ncbi:MAG TPA: polyketide synthase dehydratase domain-containing protein, partial [Polyangiales bacterium]
MVSTVTGAPICGDTLDASYWCQNLRQTVRLDRAVDQLLDRGHDVFVEVSAHPVLAMPLSSTLRERDALLVGTLSRGAGGLSSLLRSLAVLHVHGARVAWAEVLGQPAAPRASLPTYAFQRQAYWLPPRAATAGVEAAGMAAARHPWLAASTTLADGSATLLSGRLSLREHGWLGDHRVFDTVLVPGTGLVELALAAGERVGSPALAELTLAAPLRLDLEVAARLQLQVTAPDGSGRRGVSLYSQPESAPAQAAWTLHASGVLAAFSAGAGVGLATWPPADASAIDLSHAYEHLAQRGYGYGPAFRGLRALWSREGELYAEVQLPQLEERAASSDVAEGHALHPALLDAALHAILIAGQRPP